MVACHVFHTLCGVEGSGVFKLFYLSSYSSYGTVVPRMEQILQKYLLWFKSLKTAHKEMYYCSEYLLLPLHPTP